MKEEFWVAFIIWGGIIFAGLLVTLVILMIALNKNFFKKKGTIIKEIYEQKERKNGKASSHGKW